ncbi:hypothetical protein ACO0QE_002234 [Hanseniaspora vineae]
MDTQIMPVPNGNQRFSFTLGSEPANNTSTADAIKKEQQPQQPNLKSGTHTAADNTSPNQNKPIPFRLNFNTPKRDGMNDFIQNNQPKLDSFSSSVSIATQKSNFKIGEQKVQLDIDMLKNGITGITEIVVFPQDNRLTEVVFDCQDTINVIDVSIFWLTGTQTLMYSDLNFNHYNSKACLEDTINTASPENPSNDQVDPFFTSGNSVHQIKEVKNWKTSKKFDPINGKRSTSKLCIPVPLEIIQYQQFQPSDALSPFTVKIEYYIENPKEGIVFNTSKFHDLRLRSCYTNNNLVNNSTSYWVPCLESLNEKYLWQLEIMTPRTIKDIFYLNQDDLTTVYKDQLANYRNIIDDNDELEDIELNQQGHSRNYNIDVICGDATTEKVQIINKYSKKTVFQLLNPVASQHVGFVIGCFGKIVLPSINSSGMSASNTGSMSFSASDDLSMQNTPLTVYYPLLKSTKRNGIEPSLQDAEKEHTCDYTRTDQDAYEEDIINTVMTLPKMLDFYIKNFGSYPFNSYTICFLPHLIVPTLNFQGLSLLQSNMVYSSSELDPLIPTTIELSKIFATQWAGINLSPETFDDVWCCFGIAGFMSLRFIRDLMGNNELKYKLKMWNEQIVEEDYNKPPLGLVSPFLSYPLSLDETHSNDIIQFLKLKAPMVLYILDRRMTKMERSFGVIRVVQKLLVQALSGELVNGTLSTATFQHMCERVYKDKLENFFQQWVFGSGVPILRITQKFNKKRMMIEMGIKQVHIEESTNPHLKKGKISSDNAWNFVHDATVSLRNSDQVANRTFRDLRTPFFTGSMTIRVHEADGIPYEHVVRLTENYSRLEVQYNTKYKRLRNRRRVNEKKISEQHQTGNDGVPETDGLLDDSNQNSQRAIDMIEDGVTDAEILRMNCLGDVLTSKQDCRDWNLTDFVVTSDNLDENQLQNEAFEWLRVDTDFEWICKIHINQPDYMFASQLQQDKDVEAQVDSIRFFEECIEHSELNSAVYSSILTRTAVDERYFYGVRLEAIKALGKFNIKVEDYQTFHGGVFHLLQMYKTWYCYWDNSEMPLNNNFSDLPSYLVQQTIVSQFSSLQDETGEVLPKVKDFVLRLLKYNNNENNEYDDTKHVTNLINCLMKFIISNRRDKEWNSKAWEVVERLERLDKWEPTSLFSIATTVTDWKVRLFIAEQHQSFFNGEIFLKKLFENCWLDNLRTNYPSVASHDLIWFFLFNLKCLSIFGIKNKEFLKFFFEALCFNLEPLLSHGGVNVLVETINFIAVNGFKDTYMNDDVESFQKKYNPHYKVDISKYQHPDEFSEDEDENDEILDGVSNAKHADQTEIFFGSSTKDRNSSGQNTIIHNDSNLARKEAKLRETVEGLIKLLRQTFECYEPLKQILWFLMNSPLLDDYQRKKLYEIIPVIFEQQRRYYVALTRPNDRKLVAVSTGNACVTIKKSDRSKFDPPPPPPPPVVIPSAHLNIKPLKIKLKSAAPKAEKKPSTAGKTSAKTKTMVTALPKTVIPKPVTPAAKKSVAAQNSTKKVVKPVRSVRALVTKVGGLPLTHVKISAKKKRVAVSSLPFNPNLQLLKATTRSLKFRLTYENTIEEIQRSFIACDRPRLQFANMRLNSIWKCFVIFLIQIKHTSAESGDGTQLPDLSPIQQITTDADSSTLESGSSTILSNFESTEPPANLSAKTSSTLPPSTSPTEKSDQPDCTLFTSQDSQGATTFTSFSAENHSSVFVEVVTALQPPLTTPEKESLSCSMPPTANGESTHQPNTLTRHEEDQQLSETISNIKEYPPDNTDTHQKAETQQSQLKETFVSFDNWQYDKEKREYEPQRLEEVGPDHLAFVDHSDTLAGAIGEEMELDFDYLTSDEPSGSKKSSQSASQVYVEDEGKIYKKKFNFASLDCAATIVASNKEAQSAMSILQENKDRSLLFPCNIQSTKFVVIELCEDILVEEIEIANFEFFSATFEKIKVMASDRYPVLKHNNGNANCSCEPALQDVGGMLGNENNSSVIPGTKKANDNCCTGGWRVLGEFTANDTMDVQKFAIQDPQLWAKYLRVEILSHYGDEFYCPISVLRVHGKTMMDEFKQEEQIYYDEQQKVMESEPHQAEPLVDEVSRESASDDLMDECLIYGGDAEQLDDELFISNNLLLQYQSNVFQSNSSDNTSSEKISKKVCLAEFPYVKFDDFMKRTDKNGSSNGQILQPPLQSSHRGLNSGSSAEESIFKNIMKRLSLLESNASMSILYLEEQSKMLSQSFGRLETKYAQIMEDVVSSINSTMTSNIEIMNNIVDNIRVNNELLIEKELGMMHNEIGVRIGELKRFEDELSFVKHLMYGIVIVSSFLLVYVLVTREAYLMNHLESEDSEGWYDNTGGSTSPFVRANKKFWGRIMTPSGKGLRGKEGPSVAEPSNLKRCHSVSSVSSNSSGAPENTGDVVSVGSDIDM